MNSLDHLTDEKLIEAIQSAKKQKLAKDFIELLEKEAEKRGLRAEMCS